MGCGSSKSQIGPEDGANGKTPRTGGAGGNGGPGGPGGPAAMTAGEPGAADADYKVPPAPEPVTDETSSAEHILGAQYRKDIAEQFSLGKVLGKGQFGTTRIAVHRGNGDKYACKTISKRKIVRKQDREDVILEVSIMNHLSGHPNVVKLYDVFEDKRNVHIVMELCTGGELFDRIVARGHYSEKSAAQIIRAIVEVVAHCHSMGVVHRDLKPENFLLSSAGNASELKAIDFGLSSFFQPGKVLSDVVGSAYYVAPEVLRKKYGSQCDIWSCGVILYILLCGIPPFFADTEAGIFKAVIKGGIDFDAHPWPRISPEAKDCVRKMLERDVNSRASAQQILQHPWMAEHGVASDEPLENEIQHRLKKFQDLHRLKRQALKLIASYMSPEEVSGLRNQFHALDKDGNGTITVEELNEALKGAGSKLPRADVEAMMANIDMNASGAIDYEEFLAATLHASQVSSDEHLARAFAEFDHDGSGYITADELVKVLKNAGTTSQEEIDEILATVDKDKDGSIDYAEFVEMMKPASNGPVRRRNEKAIKF